MAHEITATDHLMLTKDRAWHGMGTIVQDAPNAVAALSLAKLDWTVSGYPLAAVMPDGSLIESGTGVMNVRDDTRAELGIVSTSYDRFQNQEVAEFIDSLCENDDSIRIESAGSIQGGKKIWFLIQGDSFEIRGDVTKEYILASNGYDGMTGMRFTPTGTRVVCSNTLHMVIPRRDSEGNMRAAPCGYALSHRGLLRDRLKEVKNALGLYSQAVQQNREIITELVAKDVNSDQVRQFFLDCHIRNFGPIDLEPSDLKAGRRKNKAMDSYAAYAQRFEVEQQQFGATAWVMLNAYTGMIQHARQTIGAMDDRTVNSNLFGSNAARSVQALEIALSA